MKILQTVLFLGIMFLTFYTLLYGQNLSEIYQAVKICQFRTLIAAGRTGVIFCLRRGQHDLVSAHIHAKKTDSQTTVLCVVGKEKVCSLWRCIQYSFMDFLFGHHTIPQHGGQPVQLYYMNKDGNKGSDSTIVLMTVAVIYKIVLVVLGVGMFTFFAAAHLKTELQSFFSIIFAGACAEHGCRCSCTCRNAFSTVDDCRLGVGGKAVYPARHLESKSTAHG